MCLPYRKTRSGALLERYAQSSIENILALGGDPPSSIVNFDRSNDAFQYAEQLVRFIKARQALGGSRGFGIGVAGFPEGHPGTSNRLKELDYLKRKVDAGADYICTQLFFSNADFYDFRERCELSGIKVPIIAGIMPVTSRENLVRMAELRSVHGSQLGFCERSPVAKRIPKLSARLDCTGPPNNAATYWTIRFAGSIFIRSTARMGRERFTKTWALPEINATRPHQGR